MLVSIGDLVENFDVPILGSSGTSDTQCKRSWRVIEDDVVYDRVAFVALRLD